MSFSTLFSELNIEAKLSQLKSISIQQVQNSLNKHNRDIGDFLNFISAAAEPFLEQMAQQSHQLTRQRFGKTMKLFIPIYLSNECFNTCTYCSFSMENQFKRKTLSEQEICQEAQFVSGKGFRHILLLTGESPKKVGLDYILKAVELVRPYFDSIAIEVQPLEESDYIQLRLAGVDTVVVYQETYHRNAYERYHLFGKKKQFDYRLETADRIGKAGMYRCNIGALLGLYDWRYEAISLAYHLHYLQKKYWQTKLALSIPRIKGMIGAFKVKYPISDQHLVQFITAFRLVFPDLAISLSTRESAELRDHLLPLGITDMSAESKTDPGGYTGQRCEGQFDLSDHRSLNEIAQSLQEKNYDVVLKDWTSCLIA